jgi:BMFP domain-containing protein YqiC
MSTTVDGTPPGESRRRIKAQLTKARLDVVERENAELREQIKALEAELRERVKTLEAEIEAVERDRS